MANGTSSLGSNLFHYWQQTAANRGGHQPNITANQDGEPDDFFSMLLLRAILRRLHPAPSTKIFSSFGNRKILYGQASDYTVLTDEQIAQRERQQRHRIIGQIFAKDAHNGLGALNNNDIAKKYLCAIYGNPNPEVILHIASFKSLQAIFSAVTPNQLRHKTFVTYGSVNLSWAMPKNALDEADQEARYRQFYADIAKSGATFIQIEAFPFLDTKNKITAENTPLTYSLLAQLDGPLSSEFLQLAAHTANEVRQGQVKKIAKLIRDAYRQGPCQLPPNHSAASASAPKELLLQNVAALLQAPPTANFSVTPEALRDILENQPPETFEQICLHSLHSAFEGGTEHNRVKTAVELLKANLQALAPENSNAIACTLNIYAGTCYKNQILLADQLPTLIVDELLNNYPHGLASQCQRVAFERLNGSYPTFKPATKGNLFYLDSFSNIAREYPRLSQNDLKSEREAYIAKYLKYIDLHLTLALLDNETMITPPKRQALLASDFNLKLTALHSQVLALLPPSEAPALLYPKVRTSELTSKAPHFIEQLTLLFHSLFSTLQRLYR